MNLQRQALPSADVAPWSRVTIDGDPTLIGVVTSYQCRPTTDGGWHLMVEVSYVHNGEAKAAWIEHSRLGRVL